MRSLIAAILFLGMGSLPVTLANDAVAHPPTLAATVVTEDGQQRKGENLDDLLAREMSNQSVFQIVDRQKIQAILKEHATSLSNVGNAQNAIALGRFVGADYLLLVLLGKKVATIRLVEVASGQVKLEGDVGLRDDLTLSAAAIREKALAALRPESQAANRLTVGIAAFPNRSGTDRSDKLGIEFQKALRKRLQQQPWAVVLERQYPTALLGEVDLTRLGLVRKNGVEKLPPADLVILGTLEDVGRAYEPGKPWEVKFDLTLRLHNRSVQRSKTFRSNAVDGAADEALRQIEELRRQPASKTAILEKELWRRQALYLMPPSHYVVGREPHDCFADRDKQETREMIRAWENMLLLDASDVDARLNLGICLVSLYVPELSLKEGPRKREAIAQCLSGSRLVQNVVQVRPNRHEAISFYLMAERLRAWLPDRSGEMFDYIVAHREVFPDEFKWAQIALVGLRGESLALRIDDAVRNVEKDPDKISAMVFMMLNSADDSPDKVLEIAAKYTASESPLVRFYFEVATADTLFRHKKDLAALQHFDRAIMVHEAAYAFCSYNNLAVDDIYRYKIVACEVLGKPELLRRTALEGARHFIAVNRFNQSIQWLYFHCVTKILVREGDEKEALAICDAYLRAARRNPSQQNDYGPRIVERREALLARLAGTPLPDMGSLQFARGTQAMDLKSPRMAATEGRVWLAWQPWESGGPALLYRPDLDITEKVSNLPHNIRSVAALHDTVFFGGLNGLYKLDLNGNLLKHYCRKNNSLPADHIVDLCEGGGKIYLSYRNSDRYGIAMLDPTTDHISVLAPSSRDAKSESEPVCDVYRVWWDAVNSRLYASYYLRFASVSDIRRQFGWMQDGKTWQRYLDEKAPRLVVSNDNEALLVRIKGDRTSFEFLKAQKNVMADVPLPWLMGEPAWDELRIWAATFNGLYEINRASGHVTWLAHQDGNPFLSVLKHGNRLYVATSCGLYYYTIPAYAQRDVVK